MFIILFCIGFLGAFLIILGKGEVSIANIQSKLFGNFLALLAMICDVIASVALIFYTKSQDAFSGKQYIIIRVVVSAIVLSPVALFSLSRYPLGTKAIFWLAYVGIVTFSLGYYFTYEAYKRIDGFINYMLFNLAPFITVHIEVTYFDLPLSIQFLLGGILILGSATAAEFIKTRQEKKETALQL